MREIHNAVRCFGYVVKTLIAGNTFRAVRFYVYAGNDLPVPYARFAELNDLAAHKPFHSAEYDPHFLSSLQLIRFSFRIRSNKTASCAGSIGVSGSRR